MIIVAVCRNDQIRHLAIGIDSGTKEVGKVVVVANSIRLMAGYCGLWPDDGGEVWAW